MILTHEELVLLTGKDRPGWQRRELEFLGIPCKPRSDGSLIVFWEDVRAVQGVQSARREPQLRLDA